MMQCGTLSIYSTKIYEAALIIPFCQLFVCFVDLDVSGDNLNTGIVKFLLCNSKFFKKRYFLSRHLTLL